MKVLRKREKIVPLDVKAGYLKARKLVAEKGMKLPGHLLLDDYLKSDDRERLKGLYPAWAREILVFRNRSRRTPLTKRDVFKKGKDIVDSRTRWTLPASYVPEEAIGEAGICLFIDPADVRREGGKIIVHPEKITIVRPFIETRFKGRMDEKTGIPMEISRKERREFDPRKMRTLLMSPEHPGFAVSPIARNNGGPVTLGGKRDIWALSNPGRVYGVAGVGIEDYKPRHITDDIDLSALSPDELNLLLKEARMEASELLQALRPEKTKATRRLLDAISAKVA